MTREEWDRKLSYSLSTCDHSLDTRAEMVSDTLLCLYQLGWVPLAPLGSASTTTHTSHTSVCFRRRLGDHDLLSLSVSTLSLSELGQATCDTCLCIQRLGDYLVFRGTPHTVLLGLVTGLRHTIMGVSLTIASIISDYTASMPPVLGCLPARLARDQVIQLGNTHSGVYDEVMACLVREGFGLVLDMDISMENTLYLFVKEKTVKQGQEVKRHKSVKKVNKPRVVSFRRKVLTRQFSGNGSKSARVPGPRGKQRAEQGLAWWQQASTDTSEWETETEDDDNEEGHGQ